jgi:hypothetical protein
MTGTLNMGNQPISNVLTPSAATDAANKSYVDTVVGNVSVYLKGTVRLATIVNEH